jgi:hypothetical protein
VAKEYKSESVARKNASVYSLLIFDMRYSKDMLIDGVVLSMFSFYVRILS